MPLCGVAISLLIRNYIGLGELLNEYHRIEKSKLQELL